MGLLNPRSRKSPAIESCFDLHRALRLSFQNIRLADREEASSDDAMPILRACVRVYGVVSPC